MDRKFITAVLIGVLLMMLGACTSEEGADASMDQEAWESGTTMDLFRLDLPGGV